MKTRSRYKAILKQEMAQMTVMTVFLVTPLMSCRASFLASIQDEPGHLVDVKGLSPKVLLEEKSVFK